MAKDPPKSQAERTSAPYVSLGHFVDPGSFSEFGKHVTAGPRSGLRNPPEGDGVVTGNALIDDRPVLIFAQNSGALGGSLGEMHAVKILQCQQRALKNRCPVIGLIDSGGARIQEGVSALAGYGAIFRQNVLSSGRVPQISVIFGSCAGGAVYSPALTDIVIMVRGRGQMFLTGPAVVKVVTGEDLSPQELGGSDMHSHHSGVVHLVSENEEEAASLTRRVLSYLPDSAWQAPPERPPRPARELPPVPGDQRKVYDVRGVIEGVVDAESFLEMQPDFAPNIITGFARLEGKPIGVVANQPLRLGGVLDAQAGDKGGRFVRMCDAFGLPLVVMVDTPGFLPGTEQERAGVIRRGAKLLYAFSEATVPRVTVVLRKAFGGAYIAMNSKSLGADQVFSWPTAQIAVMGAEGAVGVIHRRELSDHPYRRAQLVKEYSEQMMSPQRAAEVFAVDAIIQPQETRSVLAATFRGIRSGSAQYRHDNLPL
ncbi:acyl-CoA carboxylase subunit beta [Streptomyces sp. b94]|uniref:acyl-CoA carboxylase subunit beta n=1 Tax=Streptomyces sp. b94 TaxID=1827634 RepID=UPI001B3636BD|nr:acyl-CoA carboxylase subunit beta [Streptomyces sp. b94]MBQ1101152.1 acyl-CoA carboxylase subunit beta [Streptomyces sp. b94]